MRVLVAEDDPLIARGLAERLRSLGHEPVGPASNGAHAIELAHVSPPDLYWIFRAPESAGSGSPF